MIIIEGAWVIGPDMGLIPKSSVVCNNSVIENILPWDEAPKEYPLATVHSRRDSVISPGFINAHMHLYGVLAHGIEPPLPITSFQSFLEDYWWPLVENLIDPDMIQAAVSYSANELIASGVTTVCDVLEAPLAGYEGLAAEAEVMDDFGLRAVLSTEACERMGTDIGLKLLEANEKLIQQYADNPRISGFLCTHTAFTCSKQFMKTAKQKAEDVKVSLQFHLNESSYEPAWCLEHYGTRTCHWYKSFGLLDKHILAAQGVQLDAEEIDILAEAKTRLVHVPLSNCEVGGGISPVPDLLANGICCGLGTDGYINNFFEVMRAAFLIHKGHRCDSTVMSARTVYKMATQDGADALFPDQGQGRIIKGAHADLITITLSQLPTPVTESNIFDQLILFCNPKQVCDVLVEGKFIKKGYESITSDGEFLRKRVKEEAKRLWEAGRELSFKNKGGAGGTI